MNDMFKQKLSVSRCHPKHPLYRWHSSQVPACLWFCRRVYVCCFNANFNDNFSVYKIVLTVFKWNVQRKVASLTLETKGDLASFAADPAEPEGCWGAQVREGHSASRMALSSALPSPVFIQVRKIPPEESGGLPDQGELSHDVPRLRFPLLCPKLQLFKFHFYNFCCICLIPNLIFTLYAF